MQQPIVLTFNLEKLMRLNVIWTVVLTICIIAINLTLQKPAFTLSWGSVVLSVISFFIYYFILIILHEACHLIGFILFGRAPLSSISYGFKPNEGIAYATTTAKLTNRAMKASLLLPFWITGLVPTLIGFYMNSYMLLILGAFLMAGAVGDFVMYKALRAFPNDCLVADDADKPTLYVYEHEKRQSRS